jgi:hypothetical protein
MLKEKFDELTPKFKEGAQMADNFGGSLARQLGMASDHTKTLGGKFQKLNQMMNDKEARKGFQQRMAEIFTFTNMAEALIKAVTEVTLAFAFGVDKAVAAFVAATGASREYTSQIRNVGGAMIQFGITADDSKKALTSLYSKFPGFTDLTQKNQEELMKNVAALEKLGVASDVSAELMGSLTKSFKVSSAEAADMVKDLAFGAKAIGVPISTMISGFKEANKYLASYGKQSVDVYKEIASSARAAGVEVADVLALSKKFDTFTSAAETAAKFSAVFGTNLSALELVTMDVQDRMPYLVSQFKATGREFQEMDRYAQLSAAQILGFGDDVEKAGKVLSMSTTQFAEYTEKQREAAEQQKEYDQMLKDAMPALMKLKMAFLTLATQLVPLTENINGFTQGVLDFAQSIKDYGIPVMVVFGIGMFLLAKYLIGVGGAAAGAALGVGPLAGAMTGLAGALTGLNLAAVPAGANITIIGNAAAGAGTRMAPLIAAVGLAAVGLGVMFFGVSDLVRAFGEFPNAIYPVIGTIILLTAVIIVLGIAGMKVGLGMLAAGAAMLMFGAGVGLAAAGIGVLMMGLAGVIESLSVFENLGLGTVGVMFGIAVAVSALAVSFAALSFGIPAMLALAVVLGTMAAVAEGISKITENIATISTGSVTAAFTGLKEALEVLDSSLDGNVELKSTIENLALITTGQSSQTIGGAGITDTAGAIKDAFNNLGEMFKPTVKVELELNNDKLAEFIKTVSVK